MWINKDYCKSGYAYLTPFNNREGCLVLAVNDIQPEEIEKYWEKFLETEKLNYKIKKLLIESIMQVLCIPIRLTIYIS